MLRVNRLSRKDHCVRLGHARHPSGEIRGGCPPEYDDSSKLVAPRKVDQQVNCRFALSGEPFL